EACREAAVLQALGWARGRGLRLRVLGGGSNLVVADEGIDGLVVKIALRGVHTREAHGGVELIAAAGEPWDDLVRSSVERGWAGFECLSGIPGLVGATPMQNVGAYGQEVSETVIFVRAVRRAKATVLDSQDANRRSCGSFFTNPSIPAAELAAVESRAGDPTMPRWPLPGGQVKLSAAWLIERAGYTRGRAEGPVGLS